MRRQTMFASILRKGCITPLQKNNKTNCTYNRIYDKYGINNCITEIIEKYIEPPVVVLYLEGCYTPLFKNIRVTQKKNYYYVKDIILKIINV
jgi:hypothetical protein